MSLEQSNIYLEDEISRLRSLIERAEDQVGVPHKKRKLNEIDQFSISVSAPATNIFQSHLTPDTKDKNKVNLAVRSDHIELKNIGNTNVDLSEASLRSVFFSRDHGKRMGKTFKFQKETVLAPGEVIRVWSGPHLPENASLNDSLWRKTSGAWWVMDEYDLVLQNETMQEMDRSTSATSALFSSFSTLDNNTGGPHLSSSLPIDNGNRTYDDPFDNNGEIPLSASESDIDAQKKNCLVM